jgi:hypothetical protein
VTTSRHPEEPAVTADDIRIVAEGSIRANLRALRTIGRGVEAAAWVALALALLVGGLHLDRVLDHGDPPWGDVVAFVLPVVLGIALPALLLLVAGRAARLWSEHLALARGVNLTGLTLGEPLDLGDEPYSERPESGG